MLRKHLPETEEGNKTNEKITVYTHRTTETTQEPHLGGQKPISNNGRDQEKKKTY